MSRKLAFLTAALVLALSPGALGSFTGELDSVLADIEARRAEFLAQGDRAGRRSARTIGRAVRILKRRSVDRSLIGEIAGARAAAGVVEIRFPEETAILDGFRSASDAYEQTVAVNTIVLEALTEQPGLRRKRLRALQRKLARATSGLEDAGSAETLRARLGALLRTARSTRSTPLTGDSFAWVVATLSVAPRADAIGSHALADVADRLATDGIDLDAALASAIFNNPAVFLIELWGVDDFAADSLVFASALQGGDTDGNPNDNFSGTETFAAVVGADDHAFLRTATTLTDGGDYDIELIPDNISLAGIQIQGGQTVRIVATASETTNSGLIVVTVTTDAVIGMLTNAGEEIGPDLLEDLFALADVDIDGDGQDDAYSATLSFSSARATILPQ